MNNRSVLYVIFLFFLSTYFFITGGCKKEYSYEGGRIRDSTIAGGSTSTSVIFINCNSCNNTGTAFTSWSFKIGNSLLCGNKTKAVVSSVGDAVTLFGPSACSGDTGLILTAFFADQTFRQDRSNITAERATFEYYDNTTMSDILQSKTPHIFSLTIDNYSRQGRTITGTFKGSVVDKNGIIIKVDAGRFNVNY